MFNTGTLFSLAWRLLPRLPFFLVRYIFDAIGLALYAFNTTGSQQLRTNLARVTGLRGRGLRKVTRVGLRSYMRYYGEAFLLPRLQPDQIRARVRTVNTGPTQQALQQSTVVAALGHLGNWDLAGAWSEQNFSHVVTVAEKLEPPRLFEEFLRFRTGLGMTIFPYEKGSGVFGNLVKSARTSNALMPLLADRDLSRDGMVVEICGYPMRVAPGPAAVAIAADVPFVGVFIRHEKLDPQRRRRAGSPWGIVIEFSDPLTPPAELDSQAKVAWLMGEWAEEFSMFLRRYPQDWHMLQRCFVADLDAERLARAGGGAYGDGA